MASPGTSPGGPVSAPGLPQRSDHEADGARGDFEQAQAGGRRANRGISRQASRGVGRSVFLIIRAHSSETSGRTFAHRLYIKHGVKENEHRAVDVLVVCVPDSVFVFTLSAFCVFVPWVRFRTLVSPSTGNPEQHSATKSVFSGCTSDDCVRLAVSSLGVKIVASHGFLLIS